MPSNIADALIWTIICQPGIHLRLILQHIEIHSENKDENNFFSVVLKSWKRSSTYASNEREFVSFKKLCNFFIGKFVRQGMHERKLIFSPKMKDNSAKVFSSRFMETISFFGFLYILCHFDGQTSLNWFNFPLLCLHHNGVK